VAILSTAVVEELDVTASREDHASRREAGMQAEAVTFMVVMQALERRHRGFVLAFAGGCLLTSVYGFVVHACNSGWSTSCGPGRAATTPLVRTLIRG
jgi:hypothetical protein